MTQAGAMCGSTSTIRSPSAHYIQIEEDLDRFTGSTKLGEDYVASGTLMLKLLPGLDLHLPFVFGHLQQPFGSSLTGTIGPFAAVDGAAVNVATEDRYYRGLGGVSPYPWL